MAQSLTSSIHDHIAALLSDEISLYEFQDWLVVATWDIERHADPAATDLAYSARLALAELSRSDISQPAFQERMTELVGTPVPAY